MNIVLNIQHQRDIDAISILITYHIGERSGMQYHLDIT